MRGPNEYVGPPSLLGRASSPRFSAWPSGPPARGLPAPSCTRPPPTDSSGAHWAGQYPGEQPRFSNRLFRGSRPASYVTLALPTKISLRDPFPFGVSLPRGHAGGTSPWAAHANGPPTVTAMATATAAATAEAGLIVVSASGPTPRLLPETTVMPIAAAAVAAIPNAASLSTLLA